MNSEEQNKDFHEFLDFLKPSSIQNSTEHRTRSGFELVNYYSVLMDSNATHLIFRERVKSFQDIINDTNNERTNCSLFA